MQYLWCWKFIIWITHTYIYIYVYINNYKHYYYYHITITIAITITLLLLLSLLLVLSLLLLLVLVFIISVNVIVTDAILLLLLLYIILAPSYPNSENLHIPRIHRTPDLSLWTHCFPNLFPCVWHVSHLWIDWLRWEGLSAQFGNCLAPCRCLVLLLKCYGAWMS